MSNLIQKPKIREGIIGFLSNEKIPSLFFEGTVHLKLYKTLKSDYPRFHNAYSLQVKTGHDRKVIIPILENWAKFKLVEVIENVRNCREWRLNNGKIS
ncbi:MAG: hypothetical protein QXD43_00570 [Candidatus Aenigmatarchaeota archaeon]